MILMISSIASENEKKFPLAGKLFAATRLMAREGQKNANDDNSFAWMAARVISLMNPR